jgi:hypothetical protein
MKKIQAILLLFFAAAITVNAQVPLKKGESQLNAGLGLSGWGVPLYGGVDFGVFNDITIGIDASFVSYNEHYSGVKYSSNVFGIGANGNYHFNTVLEIPKNWDFYAGINLGYYAWGVADNYPGDNASGFELGAQIGGRYFISRKFGFNLELGGSGTFSGGKIGITYLLNK